MDTTTKPGAAAQTWNSSVEQRWRDSFTSNSLTAIIKYGDHEVTELFRENMFLVDDIAASQNHQYAIPEALGEVLIIDYTWIDSFILFAREHLAPKVSNLLIFVDNKPQEIFYGEKILELIKTLNRRTRLSFWMEPKVIEHKELLHQFYAELCATINLCKNLTRLDINLSPDEHTETTTLELEPIMPCLKSFGVSFPCGNLPQLLSAATPGTLRHLSVYLKGTTVHRLYKDRTHNATKQMLHLTSLALLLDNYRISIDKQKDFFDFLLHTPLVKKLRVEAFKPVTMLNPLIYDLFGKLYLRARQLREITLINIFLCGIRERVSHYALTSVKRVTLAIGPKKNFFDYFRYPCKNRIIVIEGPVCKSVINFFPYVQEVTLVGRQEDSEEVVNRLKNSMIKNMDRTYQDLPILNAHIKLIEGSPWNNDPKPNNNSN